MAVGTLPLRNVDLLDFFSQQISLPFDICMFKWCMFDAIIGIL